VSVYSGKTKPTVAAPFLRQSGEGARTFRYAPFSIGLDLVRKTLGQQQIATVQTTAGRRSCSTARDLSSQCWQTG